MLSLAKLRARNADAVCAYFISLTDTHDTGAGGYHTEQDDSAGVWDGSPVALAALGLALGARIGDEMRHIMHGYDAAGTRACVRNAGSPDRVCALDVTLSTPKSVSTAISMADGATRDRLLACHSRAVDSALKVVRDDYAYTRRGQDSIERQRAHLVIARFVHGVSRAGQPATHTHCLISGTTVGVHDGRTGALAADYVYKAQGTISAVYTAQLAHELERAGVRVETYEQSGHMQIRIAGWPEDLDRALSSRREAIERHAESMGVELGAGTRWAGQAANLATRQTKQYVDLQSLRESTRSKAAELGYGPDQLIAAATSQAAREALDFAYTASCVDADGYEQIVQTDRPYAGLLDELTRDGVTFDQRALARACYAHAARTGDSVDTAREHIRVFGQHAELIRVQSKDRHAEPRYTTRSAIVEGVIGSATLGGIRHQTDHADQAIVRQLKAGQAADAIASLHERGRAHLSDGGRGEIISRAVAAWRRDVSARGHRPAGIILIGATRSDVRGANETARALRRADAQLGRDHMIATDAGDRRFAVGDRVITQRNATAKHRLDRGLKNGHTHTITRVHARADGAYEITIAADHDGCEHVIDTDRYASRRGVYLDHAYALTAHASQRLTVDRAHVIAPPGHMTDRYQAYVLMSRASAETHLYLSRDDVVDLVADMRIQSAQMAEVEGDAIAHNPDLETVRAWAEFAQRERSKITTLEVENDVDHRQNADELEHELATLSLGESHTWTSKHSRRREPREADAGISPW